MVQIDPKKILNTISEIVAVAIIVVVVLCLKQCTAPHNAPQQIVVHDTIEVQTGRAEIIHDTIKNNVYHFCRIVNNDTVFGSVVSPCPPDCVIAGFSGVETCTIPSSAPVLQQYFHDKPKLVLTTGAGLRSLRFGVAAPVRSFIVGANYDVLSRTVGVDAFFPIYWGNKKK